MFSNEMRISETNFMFTASAICWVKKQNWKLNSIETYEESGKSYWPLGNCNLVADKRNPDGNFLSWAD
jgi:hypothetical protein